MVMVSKSKSKRRRDKNSVMFVKDMQVEVSSDQEGYRGAWYAAKILKPPTPKGKGRAFVRYDSLLSEDESIPLTEHVDVSFLRPRPPPTDKEQCFEPYDVVDAFCLDGWWKGVVTKVNILEDNDNNSKSYIVVFEDPPDQREISSSDLRMHWDWTNGGWVQPPKQLRMEGLNYSAGMAVEVNLAVEDMDDAWFQGSVLNEVGFNSFLVRYESSGELMDVTVDSFHIRHPPPKLEVKDFELLQPVDALYDSAWREGFIAEILTDRRYKVLLKRQNENKQLNHSQIRPHMYFFNGSWIGYPKSGNANRKPENSEVPTQPDSSNTAKVHTEERNPNTNSRKNLMEQSSPKSAELMNKRIRQMAPECETDLLHISKKSKMNSLALNAEVGEVSPVLIAAPHQEVQVTAIEVGDQPSIGFESSSRVTKEIEAELGSEIVVFVGKRGKKNSLLDSQQFSIADLQGALAETSAIVSSTDTLAREFAIPVAGTSFDIPNAVQTLFFCSTSPLMKILASVSSIDNLEVNITVAKTSCGTHDAGGSLGCTVNESDGSRERQVENVMQFPPTSVLVEIEQVKHQGTPFMKRSPIWESVESLEVFQIMPQKPHFHPLSKCNEASREGVAIGHMVTFANLVEEISNLNVDVPRDLLSSYLVTLADLEIHGFDVNAVWDHVNKFLKIIDKWREFQLESEALQVQIAERIDENTKLEEEIDTIDKNLCQLEEERAIKMSRKKLNDSDIAMRQLDASAMKECILKGERDFESIATAPWKLSN